MENQLIKYYIDQQVKHYTKSQGKNYLNKVIVINTNFNQDPDTYMKKIFNTENTVYSEFEE